MTQEEEKPGFLAGLDLRMFAPLAIMLAIAPGYPEPHLIEKVRMLFQGSLHRPIDIFDLFMHSSGLVILVAALTVRFIMSRNVATE